MGVRGFSRLPGILASTSALWLLFMVQTGDALGWPGYCFTIEFVVSCGIHIQLTQSSFVASICLAKTQQRILQGVMKIWRSKMMHSINLCLNFSFCTMHKFWYYIFLEIGNCIKSKLHYFALYRRSVRRYLLELTKLYNMGSKDWVKCLSKVGIVPTYGEGGPNSQLLATSFWKLS